MTRNAWNSDYNSAKGSLLAGNGTLPLVLTVGTNGQVLTADSAQTLGVKWATPGGFTWSDQAAPFTAASSNGYFIVATLTATLPAAPTNGDAIAFVVDGAFTLTVQTAAGQTVRVASQTSAVAGTIVNTNVGDTIYLVYRSTNTRWETVNFVGNWTVN